MIRKTILAVALGAMTLGAAACNTVRGAGEDRWRPVVSQCLGNSRECELNFVPRQQAGMFAVCRSRPTTLARLRFWDLNSA